MNIAEISVRRPVAMTMVYILICVVAMVFIPRLGIDLYPSTELPILSVLTTYPGVGPEEVDENVTDEIIDALKGVPGLVSINSISRESLSMVILEFGFGEDLDEAFDNLTSELSKITRMLPDGADAPTLVSFDISSAPMMRLGINGDLPIDELKELAENTVQPLIERIDGVSSVDINGGADAIIQVDVHHNRLEAYGLTLAQISSALSARNIQLSSGEITQDGVDYEIITTEYLNSLDDIRQTVITTIDGASIHVADVADVYESFKESSSNVYINGVQGLYIAISKETDANAATVAKSVRAILEEVNADLPYGVNLSVLSDDTTLIDSTMDQVYAAGIEGALLAALIIFLFLRNLKSAFIICLTIPISILITLMVMAMMGLTINMMTMAGLILGIGMVVDSSIVILENIFLHREKGEKSAIAAILGSRTMINAIVASTLTTLCVFAPILIYKAELKMLGELFQDMVITVCVSLSASLIVAVTLVPALCGSILQIQTRTQKPLKNKFLHSIDNKCAAFLKGIENGYAISLKFCLQNRFLVLSLIGFMLVVSVMQLSSMGLNLAPPGSADDKVTIELELPIGTNKEIVEDYLFEFQEIILREFEGDYENIIMNSGSSGRGGGGGSNEGSIQINLPELDQQTKSPDEIKAILAPYMNQWSDVKITFSAGRGIGGGSEAIDIRILSEDTSVAMGIAKQIEDLLNKSVPMVTDVATDFEDGSPRFQVAIDTEKAAAFGVSVSAIASEIRSAVNGTTATIYRADGKERDIDVLIRGEDLQFTSDLGALSVNTPTGRMTIDNFIIYKEGSSPQSIKRENGERINHITAGLVDGISATEAQAMVEQVVLENIVLPDTVKLEFSGEASDIAEYLGSFLIVILLAIFLVFAVMAAQFESFVDPFIIFMSIPLLAIGVIAVYKLTGEMLTIFSMVGIVSLAGIVVNNGIVLVDYTNQLVDKKMPVFEACIEAGRNRLQPILMSTLTTVLGMVPMAFFPGEGAEMMQPIAVTIVGGLLSGSFMTLFVSPILYSMLNKKRQKRFENPESLINQLEEFDTLQISGELPKGL